MIHENIKIPPSVPSSLS
ncbi:hypothetical protein CWATWH0003_2140b4, partial [Crocosphaera watsonii WH 0003]